MVRVAKIQVVMMERATAKRVLSGNPASIPRAKVTTVATAAVKSTLPRALTDVAYPTETKTVNAAMPAMANPEP